MEKIPVLIFVALGMFGLLTCIPLLTHMYNLNHMSNPDYIYPLDLTSRAKLVLFYLFQRKNKDNVTWPGINTIAKELSLSRSTVKRAIHELEDAGLIRKEAHYRQNGSATSNRYYLLRPEKQFA